MSSVAAMYIPKKNARNVLQDSTVVADVLQILIISMEQSMILMGLGHEEE